MEEFKTKQKWLSRKDDGRHFMVGSKQRLPKLKVPPHAAVKEKVVTLDPNELLFREKEPVDFEKRVRYFMDLYRKHYPVAAIQVVKLLSGRYRCVDGHARSEAARRLGIKIQATVLKKPFPAKFGRIVG